MSRLCMCVHTGKLESKAIIDALVGQEAISDWFYSMKGSFFFRTELSTSDIAAKIKQKFGTPRFLVVDITDGNASGMLPSKHAAKFLDE